MSNIKGSIASGVTTIIEAKNLTKAKIQALQSLFAILQYLVAEINYMTIILFHPVGSHYYKQKNPVFLSQIEEIALILAILL